MKSTYTESIQFIKNNDVGNSIDFKINEWLKENNVEILSVHYNSVLVHNEFYEFVRDSVLIFYRSCN